MHMLSPTTRQINVILHRTASDRLDDLLLKPCRQIDTVRSLRQIETPFPKMTHCPGSFGSAKKHSWSPGPSPLGPRCSRASARVTDTLCGKPAFDPALEEPRNPRPARGGWLKVRVLPGPYLTPFLTPICAGKLGLFLSHCIIRSPKHTTGTP